MIIEIANGQSNRPREEAQQGNEHISDEMKPVEKE
jgi:hypothetical protein